MEKEAYSFKTFKNLSRYLTFLGLPPVYIMGAIAVVVLLYVLVHVLAGIGAIGILFFVIRRLYRATKAGDPDYVTTLQLPDELGVEDPTHYLGFLKRESRQTRNSTTNRNNV